MRCGDCGRETLPKGSVGRGFIARCGRRVEVAGDRICETVGGLRFDADGALLSQPRPDRPR